MAVNSLGLLLGTRNTAQVDVKLSSWPKVQSASLVLTAQATDTSSGGHGSQVSKKVFVKGKGYLWPTTKDQKLALQVMIEAARDAEERGLPYPHDLAIELGLVADEDEPEPEPAKPKPRAPYPWEGLAGKEAHMVLMMRKEQLKELDLATDPAALDEWMALLTALDTKAAVVRAAEAEAEAEQKAA